MSEFKVSWVADVNAGTPREAAQKALAMLLSDDPQGLARVFTVESYEAVIDLSAGAGSEDADLSTDHEARAS